MTPIAAPSAAPHLVTLSDVAALAHVQRPVVSMWRSRAARTDRPFPQPVERHDGRDAFDLDDVVSWLEETGHGNNRAAREDGAASVALDLLPPAERLVAVDGLLALLALKTQLGTPLGGLSAADLLDLADDVDPHDYAMHREIAALGADAAGWAQHADALASAAFTPAGAATALVARHRRLGLETVSDHVLATAVLEVVARLTAALTSGDAITPPVFVAPFGDGDLLAAVGAYRGEPGTAAVPAPTGPAARHARRTLLAAGWELIDAVRDDGLVLPPTGATVLVQLPCATRPALSDADVVDALGEIEATLPPGGRAIVVGPAAALCARLPRALQSARATVLRSGRVRAIIHLPAGLWPARTRQELGLWLLGPGASDVRSAQHRTAVADLRATPLDAGVLDDLVTDLAAAADPSLDARGHAFRFARFAVTTTIIAASGDLVAAHPVSRRPRVDPATLALGLAEAYTRAAPPGPALTPWQVRPGEAAGPTMLTLGRLVELGHLILIRGNRVDEADLVEGPGVRVHTPATLTGVITGRGPAIDRLRLAAAYPRSRDTHPGDIVFTTTPRPAAVIDTDGLAIVAAPARALRICPGAPAGLLPQVVVHAIRTAPRVGGWRLWPVALIAAGQADIARDALSALAETRAATTDRLAALDDLTARLVEALTTGSVSLVGPVRDAQVEG